MKRFGLNSGYIGVDRRQTEAGIAPLQKAYLERIRGGGYLPNGLLLDLYTNAVAAYSLRKLRSSYAGSAVRVRRSSDNTEQDIGFNGLELDTTTLTSFCAGTNGFVTTWYDQSGNARNATQITLTRQPQIVSLGTILNDNLKPALQFISANLCYLEITNRPLTAASLYSFFAVANAQSSDTFEMLFTQSDGSSNLGRIEFRRNSSNSNIQILDGSNSGFTSVGSINQRRLYSILRGTTSTTLYLDGNFDSQNIAGISSIGNYISNIGARVNSQFFYGGFQQEMIIYAQDLSFSRPIIESNINSYYNIY